MTDYLDAQLRDLEALAGDLPADLAEVRAARRLVTRLRTGSDLRKRPLVYRHALCDVRALTGRLRSLREDKQP